MAFSTQDEVWFEYVLWTTYLSGIAWVFGYAIQLPLGTFAHMWLQFVALVDLYQVVFEDKPFDDWFWGPLRRAFVGQLCYGAAVILTAVPVVDWVTSPLLGYLAVSDFFDYNYDFSRTAYNQVDSIFSKYGL